LYVPQALPRLDAASQGEGAPLSAVAARILAPLFAADELEPSLAAIASEALDVEAPLRPVQHGAEPLSVLELFHGPTAAFKDFGARFLAACLERLPLAGGARRTILVATSGDTGGAVAAAFHGRPGVRVVLLFPEGRVSRIQAQQLTCWGGNVLSVAVDGSFDDCQRLVKQMFGAERLRERLALSSANSINIGRLLPQLALFASAALSIQASRGTAANFVIPSGNLGLATACAWARAMGLPIGEILLAHNANRTVPDYFEQGRWRPRPSVATLATAMDVGDPSNMERLLALDGGDGPGASMRAVAIEDAAIRDSIRGEWRRAGLVACPHTAVGLAAYRGLSGSERRRGPWVVAATAHAAKFPEVVEALLGQRLVPPPALASLFDRPSRFRRIPADPDALLREIEAFACTR
jgi:threonine synthase